MVLMAGFFTLFSLVFIVTCLLCIESSLSFSLPLFSWHSWWGKSRILNKVQHITYAGRYVGWLAAAQCNVPTARIYTDNSSAKRAQMNRNDICFKTWNVCNFLNIILDCLALFQMCVQTMYTDEWPSKGIPARSSMKWPMQGKFNMWLCTDNTGFWADLLCPGAGWWRRATQRRMGPLWTPENLQDTCRMQQNLTKESP